MWENVLSQLTHRGGQVGRFSNNIFLNFDHVLWNSYCTLREDEPMYRKLNMFIKHVLSFIEPDIYLSDYILVEMKVTLELSHLTPTSPSLESGSTLW